MPVTRLPAWAALVACLACGYLVAPAAQAQQAELVVRLRTGGDDLRGGNVSGTGNNLALAIVSSGGMRQVLARNANASATWTAGSSHEVRYPVGAMGGVTGLELTLTDRMKADLLEQPDHWDLDGLSVVLRVGTVERVLLDARGAPLHRFGAGQSRVFALARVQDRCASDAECDDGLFCNGAERCGLGGGTALRQCSAGSPPACGPATTCSESYDRCMATRTDADGDGEPALTAGGNDSDDQDPARRPGATDYCDSDGKDEDCDLATVGERDADGDGFTSFRCFNWGPPPAR